MKKISYQLAYYKNPTKSGGYQSVELVSGFSSRFSAWIWKLLTWNWQFRIEKVEYDDQLYRC